jgi:two-component system, cell cycle response regulator
VVVISGQGNEVIASRIIQAGACDYLPKARPSGKVLLRIVSAAIGWWPSDPIRRLRR